ncbi:MAG TPA: beta-eliminating lyase-related protein [Gaiellaceae bacterium]
MIDLRSDICAGPTDEMWAAMRNAELGWATLGEDASVNLLESRGAELLGKEAAVLVPTCSLANLAAALALCPDGGRAALPPRAHILVNEGDWITELAGLTPVSYDEAATAELICLENTHTRGGGTVLSVQQTSELAARAPKSHLDGARLANAAVALGLPVAALAAPVDTVAFSLNKGLCAPVGALLAGDEATIATARIHLKRLGGATIHKAGIFAAAGLVALEQMFDRLADDHARARELARLIGAPVPETNIVMVDLGPDAVEQLRSRGVLALELEGRARFVTHRLISDDEIGRAADVIASLAAPASAVTTATTPAK